MAGTQYNTDQPGSQPAHSFDSSGLSTLWMDGHDIPLESLVDNSSVAHSPEARRLLRTQRRRLVIREGT